MNHWTRPMNDEWGLQGPPKYISLSCVITLISARHASFYNGVRLHISYPAWFSTQIKMFNKCVPHEIVRVKIIPEIKCLERSVFFQKGISAKCCAWFPRDQNGRTFQDVGHSIGASAGRVKISNFFRSSLANGHFSASVGSFRHLWSKSSTRFRFKKVKQCMGHWNLMTLKKI